VSTVSTTSGAQGLEGLAAIVHDRRRPLREIEARTRAIHDAVLARAPNVREGNFTSIGGRDLAELHALYDEGFFDWYLGRAVNREGMPRLAFRVSPRMSSAGGKLTVVKRQTSGGIETRFEIAISSTLLFQTFLDVDRTISVNGILCRDRLEALQRVFEHELIHLVEHLLWGSSSCSAPRFRALALQHFGHTDVTHKLVTQRERAAEKFDIRVGDRVSFEFEGQRYEGTVNRITRRVTVLVLSDRGMRYSDGRCYLKFYVPLGALRRVG